MKSFLNNAKEFIHNPLGIIGLFISLIYGIIAFVLTDVINSLSIGLQIALIAFIVLYPILILLAFLYLVIYHKSKLYAPKDFRSDNAFYGVPLTSNEINQKYKQEIAQVEESKEDYLTIPVQSPAEHEYGQQLINNEVQNNKIYEEQVKVHFNTKEEYILLEELALRKLESDRKLMIKRKVKFLLNDQVEFWVDGIGIKNDTRFLVEIRVIKGNKLTQDLIHDIRRLLKLTSEYRDNLKIIVVFVFDKGKGEEIQKGAFTILNKKAEYISYIYYTKEALIKEYIS